MTAETPGTSLTDDRFAQHIWKIAYDAMRHEGATEDHAMAWADVLRIEVEKRARERRERVDPDLEWQKANSALPSMRCVCGHWDTDHAAFVSKVRPGRTRTFCDHCDCRSWMTPEDERAMNAARSRATDPREVTDLSRSGHVLAAMVKEERHA